MSLIFEPIICDPNLTKCSYISSDTKITYFGQVLNGKREGFGKFTNEYFSYSGNWNSDLPNGKGIIKIHKIICDEYKTGDEYNGEWKNGTIDGYGKYIFANGDIYIGKWKDNEKTNGEMTYTNGDIYNGDWKDNEKTNGEMTYANGDMYNGDWKDDQKNNCGKMTYANGDMYNGDWKDDQKNNCGKMTYANGDIYIGVWKDDNKNGYGEMTYANGDIYNGEWKNNIISKPFIPDCLTPEELQIYTKQYDDEELITIIHALLDQIKTICCRDNKMNNAHKLFVLFEHNLHFLKEKHRFMKATINKLNEFIKTVDPIFEKYLLYIQNSI